MLLHLQCQNKSNVSQNRRAFGIFKGGLILSVLRKFFIMKIKKFMLRFKSGDKEFNSLKAAKDYAVKNWPATDGMTILSPTPGVGYAIRCTNSGALTFPRVDVLCPWELDD